MKSRVEVERVLEQAIRNSEVYKDEGKLADYIPELANVEPDNFGIALVNVDGEIIVKGDDEIVFSIQSISKIIDLIMALEDVGKEEVFSKVGMEPTEYKFNSNRPISDKAANPLINAGAISTCSLIRGTSTQEKFDRVIEKIKALSNSEDVRFLEHIFLSEMETTDINRSISYYLKSIGIIDNDAEEVLELYVRNCSIGLNVKQLAHISAVLANGGRSLDGKQQLVDKEVVKITLALMAACGMYEESGQYLVEVGFPSKSGVGGAIIGIVPGKCGICTYSPRLDRSGNSVRGLKVLEEISKTLDLNIFI
ncbi:MAG: glutaminase A [Filifactor alocis]|nr:glutaminase A [Filifactor alocis]